MAEQPNEQVQSQQFANLDCEQLKLLVKQNLKQNKTLQNKNAKLESKYIDLFKQTKVVKKDHTTFVTFFKKMFSIEGQDQTKGFSQMPIGNYELGKLEEIIVNKEKKLTDQIFKLENSLKESQEKIKDQMIKKHNEQMEKISKQSSKKIKASSEQHSKEMKNLARQVENLKKGVKINQDTIKELNTNLEQKTLELSQTSKEKLKLQHHLNGLRKKQISEQLKDKQNDVEKSNTERNEFLSLRQQVQGLLLKRDQLKRQLKEKQVILIHQTQRNKQLQEELKYMKEIQKNEDDKYELIRECSLDQLQQLILQNTEKKQSKIQKQIPKYIEIKQSDQSQTNLQPRKNSSDNTKDESLFVNREYLKNVFINYLKTQSIGSLEKSLTLLEIIATILKFNHFQQEELNHYISKRRQWWKLI